METKTSETFLNTYLAAKARYFKPEDLPEVKAALSRVHSEDPGVVVNSIELKDPTVMLLISIFVGCLGIDRFLLGSTVMGLLKLFTGGLFGILWIYDIITVGGRTRRQNLKKLLETVQFSS